MLRQVSILGHSLQLDPDACELSISWKLVVCGVDTTSDESFLDDVRVPAHCKPFDRALDIYIDECVQVPSAARSSASASISACHLSVSSSRSNPIFSFVPYTEPASKGLG